MNETRRKIVLIVNETRRVGLPKTDPATSKQDFAPLRCKQEIRALLMSCMDLVRASLEMLLSGSGSAVRDQA